MCTIFTQLQLQSNIYVQTAQSVSEPVGYHIVTPISVIIHCIEVEWRLKTDTCNSSVIA